MEIEDSRLLSVLQMVMYVAKWEGDDTSAHVIDLAESKCFSELYRKVVDELIEMESVDPALVKRWTVWRAIEDRPGQLARIRKRISETALWSAWSIEQKRQWVEVLLSPFCATNTTLDELSSI
jgi:hypothetical protein